eukprot:TRINITY_DN94270_c0_g1_i1.p1 TRINITY_DN94270_c0_g1~~TRINITY_DN94270_c0_g1_i1.p1  ORF type:complete len:575 (-),score=126.38 TRINITY_DN94270_c0_g1_i1:75-1799(-)
MTQSESTLPKLSLATWNVGLANLGTLEYIHPDMMPSSLEDKGSEDIAKAFVWSVLFDTGIVSDALASFDSRTEKFLESARKNLPPEEMSSLQDTLQSALARLKEAYCSKADISTCTSVDPRDNRALLPAINTLKGSVAEFLRNAEAIFSDKGAIYAKWKNKAGSVTTIDASTMEWWFDGGSFSARPKFDGRMPPSGRASLDKISHESSQFWDTSLNDPRLFGSGNTALHEWVSFADLTEDSTSDGKLQRPWLLPSAFILLWDHLLWQLAKSFNRDGQKYEQLTVQLGSSNDELRKAAIDRKIHDLLIDGADVIFLQETSSFEAPQDFHVYKTPQGSTAVIFRKTMFPDGALEEFTCENVDKIGKSTAVRTRTQEGLPLLLLSAHLPSGGTKSADAFIAIIQNLRCVVGPDVNIIAGIDTNLMGNDGGQKAAEAQRLLKAAEDFDLLTLPKFAAATVTVNKQRLLSLQSAKVLKADKNLKDMLFLSKGLVDAAQLHEVDVHVGQHLQHDCPTDHMSVKAEVTLLEVATGNSPSASSTAPADMPLLQSFGLQALALWNGSMLGCFSRFGPKSSVDD